MYSKILVPLDGSELAECVLPHVAAIATGCSVPEVVLITVVEPVRYVMEDTAALSVDIIKLQEAQEERAGTYLASTAGKLKAMKVNVKTALLKGSAAETIVTYVQDNAVDLIAMATHGRSGISRWVWGSIADKLLRSSPVPVLIVRPPGRQSEE